MKQFPKSESISLFSVGAGIVGMAMQSWLFSTVDHKGLLPRNHISAIISFLLFAAIVAWTFYYLKNVKGSCDYEQQLPPSVVAAVGSCLAAVGFGISVMTPIAMGFLQTLLRLFGVLTVGTLLFSGYCRLQGKRPNSLIYVPLILFLICRALAFCQVWSSAVQVQAYFFPLLAGLFLLLTAYHRAALGLEAKSANRYLIFRQLALFCCLLSVVSDNGLFYLAGAVWTATDYAIPVSMKPLYPKGGA